MAIFLPTPVLMPVSDREIGHCAGEEPIPLFRELGQCDNSEIQVAVSEDGALVRLSGRIDIDSSPALLKRFLALFEAPHSTVVSIDFSRVSHFDSSGIATLIEALKIARGYKTELRLQGLGGRLLQLFQSTGILSLFNGTIGTNFQCGSRAV